MANFADDIIDVKVPPLVSVILPTYNRASYIKASIQSVLQQTFADLELIVVDDGSTDDTSSIVASVTDPRLRYVRQCNLGRSSARNHALSLARGKFITFLDSDDLYLPRKIELQVNYLNSHPGVGMIYTSSYCIDDLGTLLPDRYEATISGFIYEHIAFFTPVTITLPTVMTYKSILDQIGGFDEKLHRFEDTDMWRRISKGYRIDALPEYTCKIRAHKENSLLNQRPDEIVANLEYYSRKIMRDDENISLEVRSRGLAALYRYYAAAFLTVPSFSSRGVSLLKIANEFCSDHVKSIPVDKQSKTSIYKKAIGFIRVLRQRWRLW